MGIGTNSPLANLDVRTAGKSGVIGVLLSNGAISSSEVHRWTIRMGRSFSYPNRTLDFGMVSDDFGQNPAFYVAPKGVEVFRVTEDGNVGIGTTTPTEKLEVNGAIRAREVKLETTNWPDYVFEPGYELESLEEIEKFIQSESHLPEIPSAEEIEANGVQLGEMNKLLLKKIEELTLHTIAQQKLIEAQSKMLEEQIERIHKLEKKDN